jgi:glycosyltransferase involved in cell wall biosynthesis
LQNLTIVVPFYNEAQSAAKFGDLLKEFEVRSEITFLLVDNGSIDGHALKSLWAKGMPRNVQILNLIENRGFGGGILAGIARTRTSHVCWMPGNLKVKPADAVNLWDLWISSGFAPDAVKSSRRRPSKVDSLKTLGAGLVTSIIYRSWLFDSGATPTLVSTSFMKSILKNAPSGYDFELFVLYQMRKSRFKILRPKVNYGSRVYGNSHWQTSLRSEFSLLKQMLSHRSEWKQIRGRV